MAANKKKKEKDELDFLAASEQQQQQDELNEEHILFNCQLTVNGHIPFMFFTNHRAFSFVPSHEQLVIAKKTNTNIAILDLGNLPDYINSDKSIRKIDVTQFQDLTNKLKDAK